MPGRDAHGQGTIICKQFLCLGTPPHPTTPHRPHDCAMYDPPLLQYMPYNIVILILVMTILCNGQRRIPEGNFALSTET